MNICTKKIYCSGCKKLIKSREQKDNGTVSVLCNICGRTLYSWDGVSWKYLGGNA